MNMSEQKQMIPANLKPEIEIREDEKDFYHFECYTSVHFPQEERYEKITMIKKVNAAYIKHWERKNKSGSPITILSGFKGVNMVHDPEKKEEPKKRGRAKKTEE